jgi:predicted XRE-type DNA-binding protein
MKDPTVDHIDGNITNNHYKNLRWLERGENSSCRVNKGQGELNHEAVLTEQQVHKICKLLQEGNMSLHQIGQLFGVSKSTISNIKRKKNWTHIVNQYNFDKVSIN